MKSHNISLADTLDFNLLGPGIGNSVKSALQTALKEGVIFSEGNSPLNIFRKTVESSIRDIETHPRGKLFQEFLRKGPYEDSGKIPKELEAKRLSDEDTATVIKFIFSFMVNSFKGAVAELLSVKPCLELITRLKMSNDLPQNAQLYVGDSVLLLSLKGKGLRKGADLHILIENQKENEPRNVFVLGVVEVKSYKRSNQSLLKQLEKHIKRTSYGIRVRDIEYASENVNLGYKKKTLKISVLPDEWTLPRTFRFEESKNSRFLHVDEGKPLQEDDSIIKERDDEWRIVLKWSKEAIAEAAVNMTFWYMEKVGEVIYSNSLPKGWEGMSAAEAGRNAAKMMLYYAILRCRTIYEESRAIALYKSYGYGYSLGMNYRNLHGKREMLFPEDLDEILSNGKTKDGCSIY